MTRRGERARASVFALIVAMVGTALCAAAQPERTGPGGLPSPTGPFAIGRVTVHWIDPSRIEPFSAKPRELMIDIWYPADSATGAPTEYLNAAAFEQALGADAPKATRWRVRCHQIGSCANAHNRRCTFYTFDKAEFAPDFLSRRRDGEGSLCSTVGGSR